MTFSWGLLIHGLFAPPSICILLCLAGLCFSAAHWVVLGRVLMGLGLGSLYLLSTGLCAGWLAAGLEQDAALKAADTPRLRSNQAIVVLGAGRDLAAPEFNGEDMPNYWGTARLRYAAYLYRETGLPILVSGGVVHGEREPEASLMAQSLTRDFVANVHWQETGSATTWENAKGSYALLKPEGVDHIVLVTTAAHMWRAKRAFEHVGFTVQPAPTDFADFRQLPLALQLVPTAQALLYSRQALHEYVGLGWYALKALAD